MEYRILKESSSYDLAQQVNNAIKLDGWKPLGGVSCTTSTFDEEWSQAMIKE